MKNITFKANAISTSVTSFTNLSKIKQLICKWLDINPQVFYRGQWQIVTGNLTGDLFLNDVIEIANQTYRITEKNGNIITITNNGPLTYICYPNGDGIRLFSGYVERQ